MDSILFFKVKKVIIPIRKILRTAFTTYAKERRDNSLSIPFSGFKRYSFGDKGSPVAKKPICKTFPISPAAETATIKGITIFDTWSPVFTITE